MAARDSAPAERRSAHPLAIAATFGAILRSRAFLMPWALVFCAQVGILSWVANSSFTLVRGLGVGATAYALMFGMVSQGFFYTDIDDNWFYAFVGGILLLAVAVNKYVHQAAMRPRQAR